MVKSTKDIQIIPFVLKLEGTKPKDYHLDKVDLPKPIFCDKKLNEGFKKIGFEFENQPDMQFDIKCDNKYENIKKKGTYFFDILNPNDDGENTELYIQLYFKIFDNTENISQKLEESLNEIIKKNFENKNLIIVHDDMSRRSERIVINNAKIEKK